MSSYSNRIAAYNTKMKVYGSQMSQPEELEPVQDDTNYVTFAFYENIEDAAKDMYPGGISFAHDKSMGTGAIFKEGKIVSSKVLEVLYSDEPLASELNGSLTAKAGLVSIKYVDNNGLVQTMQFQTVNQAFVKEMIAKISVSNEASENMDKFLKRTDNISAICEHIHRIIDVSTSVSSEGYTQYKVNFKYEELYREIVRDLKADDHIGGNIKSERDDKQDEAISKNSEEISALRGKVEAHYIECNDNLKQVKEEVEKLIATDAEVKEATAVIKGSYINDVKVMVQTPEDGEKESLKDILVLSKKMNEDDELIEVEVPNEEFYHKFNEIETGFSLNIEELDKVSKKVEALEDQDGNIYKELTALHSSMDKLEDEVENEVKTSVDELKSALNSSMDELKEWTNASLETNAQNQAEAIANVKTELSSDISSDRAKIEEIEAGYKESDESIRATIDEKVIAINERLDENIGAVETLRNEFTTVIVDLSTGVSAEISQLREETANDLDNLIDSIDAKFNKVHTDIESMNGNINKLSEDCNAFISEAQVSLEEVQKVSEELTGIVDGANTKFDSSFFALETKIESLTTEVEEKNAELVERIEKIDSSLAGLYDEYNNFKTEINNKLNNAIIDIETLMNAKFIDLK